MKLWPFRCATRAGQNAMAIQTIRPTTPTQTTSVLLCWGNVAGADHRGTVEMCQGTDLLFLVVS